MTIINSAIARDMWPITPHATDPVGGAVRVAVYLAKNGVIIPAATTAADVSGSTSKNISFPWQESLTVGQYLEVFVENQSNTNDLLVENAILRIR